MDRPSGGERWFWRLIGLTAVVGAIWYYSWLWLPHSFLARSFVCLVLIVGGIIYWVRRRDLQRGAVARAAQLEQRMWQSALPSADSHLKPNDRDHASLRVVAPAKRGRATL